MIRLLARPSTIEHKDMEKKFDKFCGFYLTACAGFLNSFVFRMFFIKPAHHTGNLFLLAEKCFPFDAHAFFEVLFVVLCFLGGATLGGFVFSNENNKSKAFQSALLFVFATAFLLCGFFLHSARLVAYGISGILGLQNSAPLYFGGAKIRTTHMTGHLTDAGFFFGSFLRGRQDDLKLAGFYLILLVSFFSGSVLGFAVPVVYGYFVISGMYFLCGLLQLRSNARANS